jgi:hypothetical protein
MTMTPFPSAIAGLRVRRFATFIEVMDVSEGGAPASAVSKAWAAAVIANPFAGHARPDLAAFADLGEKLGDSLGRNALAALCCTPDQCTSYGKGAIVGAGCDIEHAAAILHPKMGRPLRALLGRGKAIIPSTVKHGASGAHIDVPLHGADDEWNFSLLDSVEVFVPGAPRHDEIVVAIAVATGGRPFAR